MKNKKTFLFGAFFLYILNAAFGNENLKISISPQFSILDGSIGEYVYEEACTNTAHLESYLDWEVIKVPTFSLEVNAQIKEKFIFVIKPEFGLQKSIGNMQDYDWLNYFNFPQDDPTELTNYSIHDNFLKNYFNIAFNCGYKINLNKHNSITPFLGFTYNTITMDGSYGYSTYKIYNWEKNYFNGKVISYKVQSSSLFLGIDYSLQAIPRTTILISCGASPFLSFIDCYDYHWINQQRNKSLWGTVYFDDVNFSWQVIGKIKVDFALTDRFKLCAGAQLFYAPIATGNDYSKFIDQNGNIASSKWSTAGAGVWCGTSRVFKSAFAGISFTF